MSEASAKIAAEKFAVPPETMAKVASDQAAVAALGEKLGKIRLAALAPGSYDEAHRIWQEWMDRAREAGIKLPYGSPSERFSGEFPSYLPEEQEVIAHILLNRPQAGPASRLHGEHPALLTTIGAPGSGKSTLLEETAADEIPCAVRVDPDEGVLENFGPYLWARHILRSAIGESADPDAAKRIEANNRWRLPPYETFRWASNAINTAVAARAVAEERDVEFHWTGAGMFGLSLIRDGYKEAGYRVDALVVVTGREERLRREARRLRPCAPEDFAQKALDFVKLLPQSVAQTDRICVYDGDTVPAATKVFDAVRDPQTRAFRVTACDDDGMRRVLETLKQDVAAAQLPDKAPYQAGLDLLSRMAGIAVLQAPRKSAPDGEKPDL